MILGICLYCKKDFRKREKRYKFCSLTCASRYNLNGSNKVTLPEKSLKLAEFIGICLGDGCAWGYQVAITLNAIADIGYIPYVKNLAIELFPGATVSLVKRKDNATDVRINSRVVVEFMNANGIVSNAKFVPDWVAENIDYAKNCIRGLFDTEGHISFKKYVSKNGVSIYKQLNFRNIDIKIMTFVRDNLVKFGLKPTMTLKKSLYLSNDSSITIFRQLVGFSNPKLSRRSLISNINEYENLLQNHQNWLSADITPLLLQT